MLLDLLIRSSIIFNLFFIFFVRCGVGVKNFDIPKHTITRQHSVKVTDFPVEFFYESPQSNDVAYIWSRVTCNLAVDVFRVNLSPCPHEEECPASKYKEDFPVDQVRRTESRVSNFSIVTIAYYRAMIFNRTDCLDVDSCRFRLMVRAREEGTSMEHCDMTFKLERGLVLQYDEKRHFNESGQHAAMSYNQLYALTPESGDDYPLYVRLDTMADSRVFLEHAWGYSTTVYRSERQGSFEVIIPLSHDKYRQGDYFWVWITILNSRPYDLQIGEAPDQNMNLFFNISPVVLLISLCSLLVLSICCYKAIPVAAIELEYPTTAPPPVTQEELELFEVTQWLGPSDDPEDLNRCTICLEEFEIGEELRLLPCSHCFHKACVDHWLLRQQRRCPLCMQDVNEAVNYRERDLSTSYFTFVEEEIQLTE